MKTFYAAAIYDQKTQARLLDHAQMHGFDCSVDYDGNKILPSNFSFHTTLIYTTELPNNWKNFKLNEQHSGQVFPLFYEHLGENYDVPVLRVHGPTLQNKRNQLENFGFVDKWPIFKPHISLSYARQRAKTLALPLPNFPLVYNKVTIEVKDQKNV